jgi:putative ABC transport system permease protein
VTSVQPFPLFVRLAWQGLARRRLRALFLAATVALAVAAVFTTAVVRRAVHDSLTLGVGRLGADLLIVPRETLVNITAALLVGEPTSRTLDADLMDEVARLAGVDAVAPQRVWALAEATAAQVPDIVVFDPARDFTVLPWLHGRLDRPLGPGDALVGGRRPERVGEAVQLGGRTVTVRGRLDLTGVGPFDRSVFVSFDTLDAGRHVSALLVRLAPGATAEQVRFALASRTAVKVVAGASLATSVRHMLTALLGGAAPLMLLVLAATVLTVGVLYSAVLTERRRELGVLLTLGARRGQVVRLILAEASLVTGAGGVAGVVLGAGALLALQRSLGFHLARLDVPFVWPAAPMLLLHGLVGVGLASCVGLAGALVPAWRLSRQEPYDLVRGEGFQ